MAKRKTIPKHLKPQRGLGQEITRARRSQRDIQRKRAQNDREQAAANARSEIERLRMASGHDESYRWANGLVGATVDSQTAVLRSMGMKHMVSYECSAWSRDTVTAWTDFTRIYLSYPLNKVPSRDSERSAIIDTIIDIRGIMQHEMGHLRFTVPFMTLHTYDAESVKPRFASVDMKHTVHFLKKIWNVLEDQRMETLVVKDVPHIRDYFTKMIYRHIINTQYSTNKYWPWLLVAGRLYLPRDVRQSCRDMFSDVLPHIDSQEWFDIVSRYKTATTYDAMIDAIIEAADWYSQIDEYVGDNPTDHRDPPNYGDPAESEGNADPSKACEPEQDDTEERNPHGEQSDDSGDEQSDDTDDSAGGDGSGQADDSGDESSTDGNSSSGGSGAGDEDPEDGSTVTNRRDFTESLRDAIHDINDELGNSHEITDTIADANARADKEGLPSKNGNGTPMRMEYVDEAMRASVGIQQALTECVTTTQPAWMSHQDSGVIDALSYRTKQVGALDYHRRLDGDFTTGLDIHVSMLCDVSGSMGSGLGDRSDIEELSIAMYAIHDACNALGIGSTYVLWSSNANAHRVWDHGAVEPMVWHASGGTNPVTALDDLTFHNEEGASKHLVIVFTDGSWTNGVPSLSRWSTDDRHIILVTLGSFYNHDKGADVSISINSCNELPNQLAIALKSLI